MKCCVNPRDPIHFSGPQLVSELVDSPKDGECEDEDEDEAGRGFSRPRSFSPSAKVDREKTNKREPSTSDVRKNDWIFSTK